MMSDYDLQFQADLEKAQALSLESLALEQFRRQKLANSDNGSRQRSCSGPSTRENPPAIPPPPRRPRANADDPDLISFTATPSSEANDPHASLKEYINRLGQQTEDLKINTSKESNTEMNNQYYNNRPPGYVYPSQQYSYNYQHPYTGAPVPPYPVSTPYRMPIPMPNYNYYASAVPAQDAQSPYTVTPATYAPYPNHTRIVAPNAYIGYPPPSHYNYSTNVIATIPSMPTRPVSCPQVVQSHNYPSTPGSGVSGSTNSNVPTNMQNAKPPEPVKDKPERNSVKPEFSRKLSEASVVSNESNDIVGSLPKSSNLIDFGRNGAPGQGSVRVSVLEAFDPLLTEQNNSEYTMASEGSSVYEEYDPLEFLYGETKMANEPVYATINKKEVPVPSPPPKSMPPLPNVVKRSTTNKLYDCIVKIRNRNFDSEHKAFLKMVLDVRNKFNYKDKCTNPGHVIAARSDGKYPPKTSIKIIVHHTHSDEPITFTSDVESTVEHVILTVVCSLDEDIREDMSGYMLRVWGANEYLTPGSSLCEYDYIRECVRLEKDVTLCLQEGEDRELARTSQDDARDAHLTLEDLLPSHGPTTSLSFDNLSIFLETLEGELSRAVGEVGAEGSCSSTKVWQTVKAICTHAGEIETQQITSSLNSFVQACSPQGDNKMMTPEIVGDGGDYSCVSVRSATPREALAVRCGGVRDAVRSLIALYERTKLVDFKMTDTQYSAPSDFDKAVPSHMVTKNVIFCVEGVHRLPPCWNHDEYLFNAIICYGTRTMKMQFTHSVNIENSGFYPRLLFNAWPIFEDIPILSLPRETRLVLTLYGRTQQIVDGAQDNKEQDESAVQFEQTELGWTALQLFDYDGMLASGSYILPLWPTSADKRTGPAPHPAHAPTQPHAAVTIEIPLHVHTGVKWSAGDEDKEKNITQSDLPSFDSLDAHTQSQLLHLIEQGAYQRMPSDCREILWEKRQYLVELAGALPLVLQAATLWYGEHRTQLISLLKLWTKPSPLNAMHLLLPCFPDYTVRETATELIARMSDDDLCRILPQLTQALRHETYECNPLAKFLLTRALAAPSVAQTLYWLLVHSLPANSYQEQLDTGLDERGSSEDADSSMVSTWRYRLLLRAMLAVCGEKLARTLTVEKQLVKTLSEVAQSVKTAKDNRQRALCSGAELLASMVRSEPATLPLGLARRVHDVEVKSCSYFNSNTLPLKINFIGRENALIPAMFKVGDDLRQDALVLQVIKVMDNLWLKTNLDLRMVTFQAIPTNNRGGMIEIVQEAETLRAIQTQFGLTGSFKDKPIAEWLAKQNPSELEYQRARDNFTASCAGYSVATYLLGICDRHNDNIMLKTSGHLFHIDFGKFLGDAQMFGNFKRDRAPFVLTHDMVYVINDGERPTQRFHHFVELCCTAFNIVRAHRDHILNLFALMVTSGVPGVTSTAVTYVRDALLPDASNAEAAAEFARLIHSSLKSKFTTINFFLHNLAQLRASGDQSTNSSELLSFMPRTYTMAQEGRLLRVDVLGYEKRYEPEKHYVYALKIERQGQATPFVLYRSYKHFTELYQKICLHFPLARVHSLPSGLHVGRSNIRQVAERRFGDVQAFLSSLFALADEIAHSDLVYTFFHPLLRDQQDVEPQRMRRRGETNTAEGGSGSLKMSIQYANGVLAVLILHAQSLALTPQGIPPNPYVKVYLMPDPTKETKRKTRVLKRNSHPSFMEMLEYRLPMDVIKDRKLHATVWHYDSLQENTFLGGVVISLNSLPLREETVSWYTLEYLTR